MVVTSLYVVCAYTLDGLEYTNTQSTATVIVARVSVENRGLSDSIFCVPMNNGVCVFVLEQWCVCVYFFSCE